MSTFQCSLRTYPAAALGVGGQSHLFTQKGALFTILMLLQWLCGIGPALAGNVGTGGAFALSREEDQGVDVPMLAPDLSRCRPGGRGSVTPIYTKGGTLYYTDVVAVALRDRSCARRERGDRRSVRAVARRGLRMMTFQCSLRSDPAAASGESLGEFREGRAPRLAGRASGGKGGVGGASAEPFTG